MTAAPVLLDQLGWHGRVLTANARFFQRDLCQQVLDAGSAYLLLVKANQPASLGRSSSSSIRRPARSMYTGHGRIAGVRHLIASTDLVRYLDWPGLAQVFRIERSWWENGEQKRQVWYGITSLPPEIGRARRLPGLKRGHWGIENPLHRNKDVSFG